MNERKIKPCKICGAGALICCVEESWNPGFPSYSVECAGCSIGTGHFTCRETAIQLWNDWNDGDETE